MSVNVDQKEYLKKYLGGGKKDEKKKKKKRTKIVGTGMKIIDDDPVDVTKMRELESYEFDLFGNNEDAPQVVGIIDERPEEVKTKELYSNKKWKVINQDDGFNATITVEQIKKKKKHKKSVEHNSDSNDGLGETSNRNGNRGSDSDLSPERAPRKGGASDSDLSPIRKSRKAGSDSDLSPPRERKKQKPNKNHSDSDLSPVRNRNKRASDSDISPPRKKNIKKEKRGKDSDSDSSPPRNRKKDVYIKREKNSDSDLSPPKHQNVKRKKQKNESDSDLSPPRHRMEEPMYQKKAGSDSDNSPPRSRRKTESTRDVKGGGRNERIRKKSRWDTGDTPEVIENTNRHTDDNNDRRRRDISNSKTRGFSEDSRDSRRNDDKINYFNDRQYQEQDRTRDNRKYQDRFDRVDRRGNDKRFDRRDDRNQNRDTNRNTRNENPRNDYETTKSRSRNYEDEESKSSNRKMDKTLDGKRAGLQDAMQLKTENDEFRKKEDELFSKLSEEFTGKNAQAIKRNIRSGKKETEEEKAQQKAKEIKQKETEAKYDKWGKGLKQVEDQDARLRDYLHEASKPLARYRDDQDLEDSLRHRERTGDPMLEYMRKKDMENVVKNGAPVRPIYIGPYPPNRFNIRPGHRWDGVDRSGGHEKKLFESRNSRKALQEEHYKWSTEDM